MKNKQVYRVIAGKEVKKSVPRHYMFIGQIIDNTYYPYAMSASARQDAWKNNSPFDDLFDKSQKRDLVALENTRSELITITENMIESIWFKRYRNRLQRSRSGAQQVKSDLMQLVGKSLTRLNFSMIMCDVLLYGKHANTEYIIDDWKKVHVYKGLSEI